MRSTASSSTPYSRVETIDWNQQRSDSPPDGEVQSNKSPSVIETADPAHAPVDIGLVLKLQQKLKDVEKEKSRLIRMVEDLERDGCEESNRTQDSFRVYSFLCKHRSDPNYVKLYIRIVRYHVVVM